MVGAPSKLDYWYPCNLNVYIGHPALGLSEVLVDGQELPHFLPLVLWSEREEQNLPRIDFLLLFFLTVAQAPCLPWSIYRHPWMSMKGIC